MFVQIILDAQISRINTYTDTLAKGEFNTTDTKQMPANKNDILCNICKVLSVGISSFNIGSP